MKRKTKLFNLLALAFCLCFANKTFADVTYTTEPVAGGNVAQGSTNNIVYIVRLDVTTTAVTLDAVRFTLSGTHDNNDLSTYGVYLNAAPNLTGAVNLGGTSAAFAAPTTYNNNFVNQAIAAGTTRYFIITVNVNAVGTHGNTVKIDGAVNPVTFTYTTAPVIINNQTDAAGIKTIQAASITYSSEPVAGGNVAQGSNNNIVYIAKVDVTTLPVTSSAMQFTLSGTHDNNDLVNVDVYTNTTPSLTGAFNRGSLSAAFAAPRVYNLNYSDFSIAAGATLYFIITVDVNASGTGGNTIKVDGAINPVTFTYTTAPTVTNNQTDAAGVKTIQNAGVTYSSEPVAGGNVAQGSTNNIVYIAKVDVTTLPVTSSAMQFTLSGTHDNNDLVNVDVYTNTTPSLTGAFNRGSLSAAFAAPQVYTLNYIDFSIAAGTTLYFIIAVDVNASGTGGNTIKVDGAINPVTFTYTTAPTVTNNQTDAAGVKTIQNAGVTYSSEPVAGGNVAQASLNNIVYIAKVDVTTLPVTSSAMQFTLSGTHDNNDLVNVDVYTNTTPSLTGAFNRGSLSAAFAAPRVYNLNYVDFSIAAGTTLYFIITVDVNASGTGGNTIKVDGAINPVTFTYTTAPTVTNNQTDAAGVKTIQNAGVTYSSEPVAGGNVAQGSNDNIVYIAKVDVTGLAVTSSTMQLTLSGTHDNNDLTTLAIYTNSSPTLSGATIRASSVSATFAAPHVYNINYSDFSIAAGTTLYFLVTVDVSTSGTGGNTVKVDGAANPVSFTFTTAPTITNNQTDIAGVKTIQAAGVTIGSEPVAGGNVAQGSNDNIVYIAKVDVAGLAVTSSTMQLTLSGTHDNNDLTTLAIYTNSSPNLSGAISRASSVSATFAAPHVYNINYSDFSIAAGTTLYFIVTVDVNASGTGGNTIKVDGAANPVTFTYTTAPPITNNQTDVAGTKTIQAADVTISAETIAPANIIQGSTNNILYIAKVDVATLPVTTTNIQFTLTGTHDNDDLTNLVIYSNSNPTLSGATNLGSFAAGFAAPQTYNLNIGNSNLAVGSTRYFIITAGLSASATINNTIQLDGLVNPVTFSYTNAPVVTNNQTNAAGIKTITTILPLTLLHFAANGNREQQIYLQWTTAGEINTNNFEVEWGIDGLQFNKVATLSAAGNSLQQKQYAYLHKLPADGVNFYRLKMTDRDGRFTYSPIAKVVQNITQTKALAAPNPVADLLQLTVQAVANETVQLRITNAAGIPVAVKNMVLVKGTNRLYWNLGQLAVGIYYIVPGNGIFEPVKIIKSK